MLFIFIFCFWSGWPLRNLSIAHNNDEINSNSNHRVHSFPPIFTSFLCSVHFSTQHQLGWCFPRDACLIHLTHVSLFSQHQATSSIMVMTGLKHNQRQHQHNTWTMCSTTHTWWWNSHHGWLIQTSFMTTRGKHAICIVHSNHFMVLYKAHTLWRVRVKWHGWESHELLVTKLATMHDMLHTKSLSMPNQHRCKCGKRTTVDDVHFECCEVTGSHQSTSVISAAWTGVSAFTPCLSISQWFTSSSISLSVKDAHHIVIQFSTHTWGWHQSTTSQNVMWIAWLLLL